jgi:hypothetical protein
MPARNPHPKKQAVLRTPAHTVDPEEIRIAANRYMVRHYPFGCLGGPPRHLVLGRRELWVVSVVLTSPGYGAVGDVGVVALDGRTRQVVGSTRPEEVAAAVQRLREEKHDELEAAFRRAREG